METATPAASRPHRRHWANPGGVPAWTRTYIGIPFRDGGRTRGGLDCWGLLWLVEREVFGTQVPSFAGDYADTRDHARIAEMIEANLPGWDPVVAPDPASGLCTLGAERPGDGVLLRRRGRPLHVGVVVAPGRMLHVERGTDTVLARYDGMKERHRVLGIYRHAGAA